MRVKKRQRRIAEMEVRAKRQKYYEERRISKAMRKRLLEERHMTMGEIMQRVAKYDSG